MSQLPSTAALGAAVLSPLLGGGRPNIFLASSYAGGYNQPFQSASTARPKRSFVRLLADILLLFSVLAVTAATWMHTALPAKEVGGDLLFMTPQNLFEFLFYGNNSLLTQIIETFQSLDSGDENTASLVLMTGLQELARLFFLAVPTVLVAVRGVIYAVSAIGAFFGKRSVELGAVAVKNWIQNTLFFLCFAFFGFASGGSGLGEFFEGYTTTDEMAYGMGIGLFLLIVAAIMVYNINKKHARNRREAFFHWMRMFLSGIGCAACAAVIILMKNDTRFFHTILRPFLIIFDDTATDSPNMAVVLLLINLSLLVLTWIVNGLVTSGFSGAFYNLFFFGERNMNIQPKDRILAGKYATISFIPIAVLSAVAFLTTLLLSLPDVTFSGEVGLRGPLAHITLLAVFFQIFRSFWKRSEKERRAEAEQRSRTVSFGEQLDMNGNEGTLNILYSGDAGNDYGTSDNGNAHASANTSGNSSGNAHVGTDAHPYGDDEIY